jgi:hypothetical protein
MRSQVGPPQNASSKAILEVLAALVSALAITALMGLALLGSALAITALMGLGLLFVSLRLTA